VEEQEPAVGNKRKNNDLEGPTWTQCSFGEGEPKEFS
jgi:hypothetical protein